MKSIDFILKLYSPKSIIHDLTGKGAQAIVLGCMEIRLLIKQQRVDRPLIDTRVIHSVAAWDYGLG